MLADAVIANLDHLPRREDVCDGVPAPAGLGGLADLMQVQLSESSMYPEAIDPQGSLKELMYGTFRV